MHDWKVFNWLKDLSQWGETSCGVMRLAFSQEEAGARRYVIGLMEDLGMQVRMDAAANIIGRYEGSEPGLPSVAIGSHLDSVPHGGRYDGVLGVLAGLDVVRSFRETGFRGRHPLEVIIFSNEEGCRFSCTFFGSSAMMGLYAGELKKLGQLKDEQGISLEQALNQAGGELDKLGQAERKPQEFKAFLEMHIEQGAVLDEKGISVGIVEGISAPARYTLRLKGRADHAGATPMYLRRDALVGASEIVAGLETIVTNTSSTAVGTVGELHVYPGAVNVIPGEVSLSFDIRDIDLGKREIIVEKLKEMVKSVCSKRLLTYRFDEAFKINPIFLDSGLVSIIEKISQEMEMHALRMISGAGHDAMVMAKQVPTGMIFVPSKGGLSHCPEEETDEKDIAAGLGVLRETVRRLII